MSTEVAPRKTHDSRVLPVVSALEGRGLLDPTRHEEALDVVDRVLTGHTIEAATLRRRLAELAGYVGGAFVVIATGIFVADRWNDMSVTQQVTLFVGIAVVLFAVGIGMGLTGGGLSTLRLGTQPVRTRLASVLFTAGAAAAAASVMVWLIDVIEERGTEMTEGVYIGMGGSVTFVVLAAVGYLLSPSLLGQGAIAVGTGYAIPFIFDSFGDMEPIPIGMTFLAVGVVWLVLAERRMWREVVPGRVIGAVLLVAGAQVPLGSEDPWVAYLATFLVGVVGFSLYLTRRAWPYLGLGVVGVTLAVPEALLDWTEGSLGPAGVLLVAGLTLLGASLLGMRLRREVTESD